MIWGLLITLGKKYLIEKVAEVAIKQVAKRVIKKMKSKQYGQGSS